MLRLQYQLLMVQLKHYTPPGTKLILHFLILSKIKSLSHKEMLSTILFCIHYIFCWSIITLKMYKLTEEQRWYIIIEWKKGSINVTQIARSFNCCCSTVYHVIGYYRRHNDVSYTDRYNAGRRLALDSTQIEQLDQTIRQNRSAIATELLSLANFNTSERTIRRYRLSLGYRPHKSVIKVKSNNLDEQKRYQLAAMHCGTNIKKYIFEDECYLALRDTQQIVWCKRGEPTPKKEISSLRVHVDLIGCIW